VLGGSGAEHNREDRQYARREDRKHAGDERKRDAHLPCGFARQSALFNSAEIDVRFVSPTERPSSLLPKTISVDCTRAPKRGAEADVDM
jgi:hypothetical protein